MSRITIIYLALFVLCTWADITDPKYSYADFAVQFNRTYEGIQKEQHEEQFNKNYAQILRLNNAGANLKVNKFLDWTQTDKKRFFNYHPEKLNLSLSSSSLSFQKLFMSPTTLDWRIYDRVTDVKDQGMCGSCWAFAATAQYQSLLAIATNGTKYDLSEQYLRQCDYYSFGCDGGYPFTSLGLASKGGMPLESLYPYLDTNTYSQGTICNQTNKTSISYSSQQISHAYNITNEQIQQYLLAYGPLSVGVYANNMAFMYAGSSTISCPQSTQTGYIDHAILLIGYTQTYWIVKNSWGTQWGDDGFGYISKINDCNIRYWVDSLRINFPWSLIYSPPLPQPEDLVDVTIMMNDSYGDGWNGNILGLKQNGSIVATFGAQFKNGSTYGPVVVSIPNKTTQIVVTQYSSWVQQIGFTIKRPNNQIIYFRINGSYFQANKIFTEFCPSTGCIFNTLVTYYLTLTDSYGDGWNGNALRFRQSTNYQSFQMQKGYQAGPSAFTFTKGINVEVIVFIYGYDTSQLGFTLREAYGAIVAQRLSGTSFSANSVLVSFIPGSKNLSPVTIITNETEKQPIDPTDPDQQIDPNDPDQQIDPTDPDQQIDPTDPDQTIDKNQENRRLEAYKIATFILAPLLLLSVIISSALMVKLIKERSKTKYIPHETTKQGMAVIGSIGNGIEISKIGIIL